MRILIAPIPSPLGMPMFIGKRMLKTVQKSFAYNPEYSRGVKEFISKNKLPIIESVLDIVNDFDGKLIYRNNSKKAGE